ncbi:hypothetical protein BWD07_11510 [Neisseria canis]|uniref:hypothetical protein n=1 Tax=Neisseria canis TaxID=493 RepID=UPI000A18E169|nr:hypothetical protein [Neisseria canis]OSI09594.1 hypothetical protein BWD07_11510 [Neisseria canis]
MDTSITHELAKLNNHIKTNFNWLDFQVTLLDFTKVNIIASDDPSYYFNYDIDLYNVKYLSGNLTWSVDVDECITIVELIDKKNYDYLPELQENCFFLKFHNTDLATPPFVIMASNISVSYEKKYFNDQYN